MDFRPALAKVRGLGSAKTGTSHWWMQRVTAAALVPLSLWLVVFIDNLSTLSHPEMIAWLSSPMSMVLLVCWVLVGCYHAALGLQVVIEDYIHTEWMKIFSVWTVKLLFAFFAIAGLVAMVKILITG